MKFNTSKLANRLLTGLSGIEIGGSAHNSFDLDTLNVDYTDSMDTVFKDAERDMCGEAMSVDIIAFGDDLPFADSEFDFVISSHVIEHFWCPIKAIKEWHRVTKKGGYIYIVCPHKNRIFDKNRPVTDSAEIRAREGKPMPECEDPYIHWSVWTTQAFVKLCKDMGWNIHTVQDVDDKVGNGFTVVLQNI